MRRTTGTTLATVAAIAALLVAVGVTFATTPSPDATESPAASSEPDPATTVDPTVEPDPSTTVDPTAEPAADPTAAPGTPVAPTTPLADDPGAGGPEPTSTLRGVLRVQEGADGRGTYLIGDVRLSVGPPWFWGENHPLADLVGRTITVTGREDDGANGRGRGRGGDEGPSFDVFAVNGTEIRQAGRPPWAGGPRVVGPSHPGYQGWFRGQANRPATGD